MLTSLTWNHVNIVNMARREKIPEHSTEQRDTYHHGDLKRALTEAALGLVKEKSQLLTITLRRIDGTLTSAEADRVRDQIVAACQQTFGAQLRA